MRDSFVFYRSFYEAIHKIKDNNIKADIYDAICELALNENVKELGSDVGTIIMDLIKPQLEANQKRFINGSKGGNPNFKKGQRNPYYPEKKDNIDNQKITKTLPNVNVNDNVNVNVNDNDNDNVNVNNICKKEILKKKYFENEGLNDIFIEFLQLRKKIKAVNSDRAINSLIKKLNNYDDDTKIKMIEQSIVNSWKDVYEIKYIKPRYKSSTEKMNEVFERFLARGEDDEEERTN